MQKNFFFRSLFLVASLICSFVCFSVFATIRLQAMHRAELDMTNESSEQQKIPEKAIIEDIPKAKKKYAVEILSTDSLRQAVASDDMWMVMFHSPFCGHCKKFIPIFEEFGRSLYNDQSIRLGTLSCTDYEMGCQNFKVRGVPAVKLLYKGEVIPFPDHERTVEELSKFLENQRKKWSS
ncbi:putative thioredoxin domain-containing protein 10 [Monocercomonoides exilis]|uniref:putative thioredoxin domain-containing protein 10 n=1 Tax=Monocercomonoides exilis TaxID=2049356 RepID=UPI00355A2784|nr:putative thioredoxin domain-containing protein 10 [Monocercomonoides exilis]